MRKELETWRSIIEIVLTFWIGVAAGAWFTLWIIEGIILEVTKVG